MSKDLTVGIHQCSGMRNETLKGIQPLPPHVNRFMGRHSAENSHSAAYEAGTEGQRKVASVDDGEQALPTMTAAWDLG